MQKSGGADFFHPASKSYLSVLLIFVPLGLISTGIDWAPDVVFVLNFLAVVSLSGIVQNALEDLSVNLNNTLKRLLVAFSDNVVELIVSRRKHAPV